MNEEVINAWHEKTGLWIREGYGQTETTLIAATSKDMTIKPGSMGKAAPGNFNFWCTVRPRSPRFFVPEKIRVDRNVLD